LVKRFRALSSGCIRVQRPLELAIYILEDLENKRYTHERLDSVITTHKTRWEVLKNKIPVHITYLTAFEDTTGRHIQFTRDIYRRDDKLMTLLNWYCMVLPFGRVSIMPGSSPSKASKRILAGFLFSQEELLKYFFSG